MEKLPKKPLPKTLSGWITAAVEDAKALSKKRGFKLNMYEWNAINYDGTRATCMVCLGGACIVGRGIVAPGEIFSGDGEEIAYALDDIRSGNVEFAAKNMLHSKLISWIPSKSSIERATNLIQSRYREALGRAPFETYLEAARMMRHKPKK